jgi:hypothetical protein
MLRRTSSTTPWLRLRVTVADVVTYSYFDWFLLSIQRAYRTKHNEEIGGCLLLATECTMMVNVESCHLFTELPPHKNSSNESNSNYLSTLDILSSRQWHAILLIRLLHTHCPISLVTSLLNSIPTTDHQCHLDA